MLGSLYPDEPLDLCPIKKLKRKQAREGQKKTKKEQPSCAAAAAAAVGSESETCFPITCRKPRIGSLSAGRVADEPTTSQSRHGTKLQASHVLAACIRRFHMLSSFPWPPQAVFLHEKQLAASTVRGRRHPSAAYRVLWRYQYIIPGGAPSASWRGESAGMGNADCSLIGIRPVLIACFWVLAASGLLTLLILLHPFSSFFSFLHSPSTRPALTLRFSRPAPRQPSQDSRRCPSLSTSSLAYLPTT
ncbi:hypothetical protein J3F83DRAFT_647258 [Trichoderma novae-zelandiae]